MQTTKPKTRAKEYQRHNKPPYTYLGMMVTVIETAHDRKLTLNGIHGALSEMFPFFTEAYTGWKGSVRHNLSNNACFYKVLRDPKHKKNPKGNYWKVDLAKVPRDAFKRQLQKKVKQNTWAKTLHQQLGMPAIALDSLKEYGSTLTVVSSMESPPHSEEKKGVVNFKIDTILKIEVKKENRSPIVSKCTDDDDDDSQHSPATEREVNMFPCQFPRIFFNDNNPLVLTLLRETARQYHDNQSLAIENLRSLCPPANYGTPQNLHRTWTTQPFSPLECYHGIPLLVPTDVIPDPMDVSVSGVDKACCAIHQNKPAVQFCHDESVSHQTLRNYSASFVKHETDENLRAQNQVYECNSYIPRIGSFIKHETEENLRSQTQVYERASYSQSIAGSLPFDYHEQSILHQHQSFIHPYQPFIHPDHSLNHPNQPFMHPNQSFTHPNQSQPFNPMPMPSTWTTTYSPRQTPPNHNVVSPMSLASLEDSRSSFMSASCQSRLSSAEAPSCDENSPASSFSDLHDVLSDTSSRVSDDVHACHLPNCMFMRTSGNSSRNDVNLRSPTVWE